jgi:hypothetical protein
MIHLQPPSRIQAALVKDLYFGGVAHGDDSGSIVDFHFLKLTRWFNHTTETFILTFIFTRKDFFLLIFKAN